MKLTLLMTAICLFIPRCATAGNIGMLGDSAVLLARVMSCPDARERVLEHYLEVTSMTPASSKREIERLLRKSPAERVRALDDVILRTDAIVRQSVTGLVALARQRDRDLAGSLALAKPEDGDLDEYLPESEADPALQLNRLWMRSHIEPEYDRINAALDNALTGARALAQELGIPCAQRPAIELNSPLIDTVGPAVGSISQGAKWTMATAYQSRKVLDLPPVTSAVMDVEGVAKDKKYDGGGWGRRYRDVSLLKRTHYYHRGLTYSGSCMNQDSHPLVYDYGGVPCDGGTNSLNLFRNCGGGPALGIDCSAFVSVAAATSGSLYSERARNRSTYIRYTSADFINPEASNWDCYDLITVGSRGSIASGDIAAVHGHVLMVDTVGVDPFGIATAASIDDCDRLQPNQFNFVLIQSSSSQKHLGINRYEAREYLRGGTMTELFLAYARGACRAKFDGRTRKLKNPEYGIIRHRNEPACLAPRVKLKHEECVAS